MSQTALDAAALDWSPTPWPGVTMKRLHHDAMNHRTAGLTRLAAGATIPAHRHPRAEQHVFVVEGDRIDAGTTYGLGSFIVVTADPPHGPHGSAGGCVLLTTYAGPAAFVAVE